MVESYFFSQWVIYSLFPPNQEHWGNPFASCSAEIMSVFPVWDLGILSLQTDNIVIICMHCARMSVFVSIRRKPSFVSHSYCLAFFYYQVVCRCANPLDTSVKEKISMFCHVEPEQVSRSSIFTWITFCSWLSWSLLTSFVRLIFSSGFETTDCSLEELNLLALWLHDLVLWFPNVLFLSRLFSPHLYYLL